MRQNGQADLWLVIFLAVLLAQSAFSLFAPAPVDGSGGIDVIVRTSAAAIFGYFLSSGARPQADCASAPSPVQASSAS